MSLAHALPPALLRRTIANSTHKEERSRTAMLAGKEICDAGKSGEKRVINAKRSFASSSVPARFRA
jgi:hypothetical protein